MALCVIVDDHEDTREGFALLLRTLLETTEDIGLAAHQRTLRSLLAAPGL